MTTSPENPKVKPAAADAYQDYLARKRAAEREAKKQRERAGQRWDLDGMLFLVFFGPIILGLGLLALLMEKLGLGGGSYVDLLAPRGTPPPPLRDVYNPRYRERR